MAETQSLSLLVIDNSPLVRQGVRALIAERWPKAKVDDAPSVEEAFAPSGSHSHDVVVVDPWRPGTDPADTVSSIKENLDAPIVVFTADGGARLLSDALKAGVKGYVRKDSPADDLTRAIHAARNGEFYVDPGLSSAIVLDEGDRTLSARQREILQMLADGMQTDTVAEHLGLSTETVRTHTKRILAKLEASTRTQAVAIGIRHGLIE
jgi:DNA-binding NarL/FixJ family response regulator